MVTAEIKYLGNLRTECHHFASGTIIETDAPTDNKGKGERFSPTDLVATAYASCMLTIMAIYCNEQGIEMHMGIARVQKIMEANPRRIGKIIIDLDFSGNNWSELEAEKAIRAGRACPVAKTLGDNVEIEFIIKV